MRPGAAFLTVLLAFSPAAWGQADPGAGRKLAIEKCARCHVVSPDMGSSGIDSTPSFLLMAKKWERYEPRVRTMTKRRPHIALKFKLSEADIANLLAHIRTLRPK